MAHLSYLGVLLFCLCGTAWLEVALRTRVYRRWHRLVLSILPVVVVFTLWDKYAIARGHWWFDSELITTVRIWSSIPLDEILFFIVIPICAVLTFEAVRSVTGDEAGDEVTTPSVASGR